MVQISLPAETEEVLRARAKASGEDVSSYAARLLQQALTAASVDLAERGIDEHHAADLRQRLKPFVDDWDRPEMDVYDAL